MSDTDLLSLIGDAFLVLLPNLDCRVDLQVAQTADINCVVLSMGPDYSVPGMWTRKHLELQISVYNHKQLDGREIATTIYDAFQDVFGENDSVWTTWDLGTYKSRRTIISLPRYDGYLGQGDKTGQTSHPLYKYRMNLSLLIEKG